MRHARLTRLRRIVESPLMQFVSGCVLLGTSTVEVFDDFAAAEHSWRVGSHHGVFLFGILQVLQCAPGLVEGFERWFRAIPDDSANTPPANPE